MTVEARELELWLESVSGAGWTWYAKYLSANDTYAKANVHQAGPHLGRPLFAAAFRGLSARAEREENPDLSLPARIDSHSEEMTLRLVWYNSKRLTGAKNGRDEARLTQWGGKESSIVTPDATGSLVIFAFKAGATGDAEAVRIWRCRTIEEEDLALQHLPDVAPGAGRLVQPFAAGGTVGRTGSCSLSPDEIPAAWRAAFPSGEELVAWAAERRRLSPSASPDERLIARRDCEEQVFYSIERHHAMPRIDSGFTTVEEFVEFAGSLTNRRKSRAGRSLELQTKLILQEERIPFAHLARTEQKKTPDFLFPSETAYRDHRFPGDRLRMLAAKTTCKDRWRQVLNEADRIGTKHLLTLQQGVSEPQFREMQAEHVQLVVPSPLLSSYPAGIRRELMTLDDFIKDVRRNSVV